MDNHKINVPLSTLSTWWSPNTLVKVDSMPKDRLNVQDTRYNPTQRPDVLVDIEIILLRKFIAIKLTGMPYTRAIVQVLAI